VLKFKRKFWRQKVNLDTREQWHFRDPTALHHRKGAQYSLNTRLGGL